MIVAVAEEIGDWVALELVVVVNEEALDALVMVDVVIAVVVVELDVVVLLVVDLVVVLVVVVLVVVVLVVVVEAATWRLTEA